MDLIHALILGIVEGITEFLPISSTGHLILTSTLLGIEQTPFVILFEVCIQLGAILAVVACFPKRLFTSFTTMRNIAIAFIPTALIGLVVHDVVKSLFSSPFVILAALAIGGVVIILLERYWKHDNTGTIESLTPKQLATIGALQTLAFVPGVSRAATTIFAGMWMGLSRTEAALFSFFLAIPTMAAAAGLDLLKTYTLINASNIVPLLVGLVAAFVTALVVIRFLLKYVSTHDFTAFGYYRIFLALLFFLFMF